MKKVKTVRIDPKDEKKIIAKYGSFTSWVNAMLKRDKKLK
jgi:hypothetical protein